MQRRHEVFRAVTDFAKVLKGSAFWINETGKTN